MGLKRKASALEFDAFQQSQWPQHASFNTFHQPSSPPSLTSDSASPASSPSSMDTEPFHTLPSHSEASYFTHAPNAPWLHTRTRKRVRDNRPSESQIHDATMRRLFDAQRAHHQHHTMEDAPMMEDGADMPLGHNMMDTFSEPAILPSPTLLDDEAQEMQLEDYAINLSVCGGAPEANQRSIHDFFARQKGKERECVPVGVSSIPMPMSVPSETGPTIVAPQQVHHQQPLKERRSFGVLGDIANRGAATAAGAMVGSPGLTGPLLTPGGGGTVTGSCLPCDFRPAEVVHAMMDDAMVMG